MLNKIVLEDVPYDVLTSTLTSGQNRLKKTVITCSATKYIKWSKSCYKMLLFY